jgi:mono/diheme cytochrome c family protein
MKRFGFDCGRTAMACAILAVATSACAPLQQRVAPLPVAPAATAPMASSVRPAGEKIFDKWCGDCHATAGGPGSLALQRKYKGALPAILEQRSDLPPEYVALAVRRGVSFMPSFRKTEISDDDLALVAGYLAKRP